MSSLLIAGDYCPQERVAEMLEKKDFSFFDNVRKYTQGVEYSIVNLECPVADESHRAIIKTGRNLRCNPGAIDALNYAGFKCVTLANNHLNDYGGLAILQTLNELETRHIAHVGGGENLKDSQKPLTIELNGKRVSILNFCEKEFSIATKRSAGAAPLDLIDNQRAITSCKSQYDYVIVIVHGGHEMHQLPSPMMQKTYRWFIDMGADAVINHHQHCYSGYEVYNGKPIFYGLGNFCFDKSGYRNSIWNEGYMVKLKLEDRIGFELIPYHQCDNQPEVKVLEGKKTEDFSHSLAALNNIIADPLLVEADFERYYKQAQKSVLGLFSPYLNRYLRGAAQKGIIPLFLPQRKIARIYDYFNCEAHKNIALRSLRDFI